MGKYKSDNKYLADFSTDITDCLQTCTDWEALCPDMELEDQTWRFDEPCNFACGGFAYHAEGSRCKLYKYSPTLKFTSDDVHFWAHIAGIYSMGPCTPAGTFEKNECCPPHYSQIVSEEDCHAAFDILQKSTVFNQFVTWGGSVEFDERPSGCFLYTPNNNVHFNPTNVIDNGQVMVGDDKVLCRKDEINYSVGNCLPSGEYSENECCPDDHKEIENGAECKLAYDSLSGRGQALFDAIWDENEAPSDTHPSGCFWDLTDKKVHFNPTKVAGNGLKLEGSDKVVCKKRPTDFLARKLNDFSLAALSAGPEIPATDIKYGLQLVAGLEEQLLLTSEYAQTTYAEAAEAANAALIAFEEADAKYNQCNDETSSRLADEILKESIAQEKTEIRITAEINLEEKYSELGSIRRSVDLLRKFNNLLQVIHGD